METMLETSRFIVDASVATKWQLRDEQFLEYADQILHDFQEGRIDLLASDHIRYEVPSAIRKCVRTRRLTNEQSRRAIVEFLGLNLSTVANDHLILTAFDLTVQFNCSLYDGLYLALSEATGYPLIHADDRLRRAIDSRITKAIWIEDWRAQSG
jgi:predicted nucleic acid-binding protein